MLRKCNNAWGVECPKVNLILVHFFICSLADIDGSGWDMGKRGKEIGQLLNTAIKIFVYLHTLELASTELHF